MAIARVLLIIGILEGMSAPAAACAGGTSGPAKSLQVLQAPRSSINSTEESATNVFSRFPDTSWSSSAGVQEYRKPFCSLLALLQCSPHCLGETLKTLEEEEVLDHRQAVLTKPLCRPKAAAGGIDSLLHGYTTQCQDPNRSSRISVPCHKPVGVGATRGTGVGGGYLK